MIRYRRHTDVINHLDLMTEILAIMPTAANQYAATKIGKKEWLDDR